MTYKITPVIYCFIFFISCLAFSQKANYATAIITDSLSQDADAVIRLSQIDLDIASAQHMTLRSKRVVTVFNPKGLDAIAASCHYNKATQIKSISAFVYDQFGNLIKKIKRADFVDRSASVGNSLFTDYSYLYLDYTPPLYPFTVEFNLETESSNTAFIPQWMPLPAYGLSVENSRLQLRFASGLGFRYKELQFSNFKIKKTLQTANSLAYEASGITARRAEVLSPSISSLFPRLMMGLERFHLEGVDGNAKNWTEFGKWYDQKMLQGTTELPQQSKEKIKSLVGEETDPIKKAKIVYNYVQQKSRYVSIQLGIGGWKPMLANEVDRLGYGDCKALSNYTRALLQEVGVPSYTVILYAGTAKRNIEADFVSMQGNHMILAIPNKDSYVFLECTSSVNPFGYLGKFSDDRTVLLVKPEGAEIVQTPLYSDAENVQSSKGSYVLAENGDLSGSVEIQSEGLSYGDKFRNTELTAAEREKYYKDYWPRIQNLQLNKVWFKNDSEKIRFTEHAQISAPRYGSFSDSKLIFVLNVFNPSSMAVMRSRNRQQPVELQRGSLDVDEVEIALPPHYEIEFLPKNMELKGKFGEYQTQLLKKSKSSIVYKRSLLIKSGLYSHKEYEEFRLFMEQIGRNDNAKMILIKS